MKHRRRPDAGRPLALIAGAAVLLAFSLPIAAQAPAKGANDSGSLVDSRGEAVRNASYLCWHTGFWTPAAAVAECEPDLVAKPAPPVANAKPQPGARPPAKGETARR